MWHHLLPINLRNQEVQVKHWPPQIAKFLALSHASLLARSHAFLLSTL